MKTATSRFALSALLTLTVLIPLSAKSEDGTSNHDTVSVQSDDDQWSFRVAPYVWATALNGDTGVDGRTAHVNATIGEVVDHVDGGAMLTAEARYGRAEQPDRPHVEGLHLARHRMAGAAHRHRGGSRRVGGSFAGESRYFATTSRTCIRGSPRAACKLDGH